MANMRQFADRRINTGVLTLLILGILLTVAGTAWGALQLPPAPVSNIYVQDYAGLIDGITEERILRLGEQLDNRTTAQLVVVTVPDLQGYPITEYANELLRKWGIGSKKLNNGVLLLVSRDDRRVRVEVGYGLEGALPDGLTGRILDEKVLPFFKQGDYDSGIWAGYMELARRTAAEYNVALDMNRIQPEPEMPRRAEIRGQQVDIPWWVPVLVLVLFVLDIIFNRGRVTRVILDLLFWMMLFRGGRGGGGGFGGGGFGGGSSGGGGSDRRW